MLGFSIWELFTIGLVALVVLGPERLPRTARTIGALVGKAQRYVNDVKAEVNRAVDLEELKKMKSDVETSARDVQQSMQSTADDFEKNWAEATAGLGESSYADNSNYDPFSSVGASGGYRAAKPVKKNWRVKRAAMPLWYKQRHGIGGKALSGAARVAKYRPKKPVA